MPNPKPRPATTAAEIVRFGKLFRSPTQPLRKGKAYVAATSASRGQKKAPIRVLGVHQTPAKAWAAIAAVQSGRSPLWKAKDAARLRVYGPFEVAANSALLAGGFDVCWHDCSCETVCATQFAATEEVLSIELSFQHRNRATGREKVTTLMIPLSADTIFLGRRSLEDYTSHHG